MNVTLLGQLPAISSNYREATADPSHGWVILLLIPLAIVVGAAIYVWVQRPPPIIDASERLLADLCRGHRLPRRSTELLLRISHAAELEHPASLVVTPANFDRALTRAEPRLKFSARQRETLAMTRRTLFAAGA